MSKTGSLRLFQEHVSARIKEAAAATTSSTSKLGIAIGDQYWLVDLLEVSEVVPVPTVAAVPLVKPWFRGVTNVRGNLYSVTDAQSIMGGDITPIGSNARLLLVHARHSLNTAILVGRILGLKNLEDLQEQHNKKPMQWQQAEYLDRNNITWREVDVAKLVKDPTFLQIAQTL